MAMQKLYQTFVAQAAQLQSVHENVKVSFPLPPLDMHVLGMSMSSLIGCLAVAIHFLDFSSPSSKACSHKTNY